MSSRGQFVIPVTDLDVDGRHLEAPIPAEWLRAALEDSELKAVETAGGRTPSVDVHANRVGEDVLVRGQVRVSLEVPCARCLDPIRLDPEIELSLLFTKREGAATGSRRAGSSGDRDRTGGKRKRGPAKVEEDEEAELSAGDPDRETYEGEEIVLDPFIREAILLESPNFPLCSEACEGIRPRLDEEQARSGSGDPAGPSGLDPRLSPLLELVKKRSDHS